MDNSQELSVNQSTAGSKQVLQSETALDQEELVVLTETPSDSTVMLGSQALKDPEPSSEQLKLEEEERQKQLEMMNERSAAFELELHELSTVFQISNQSVSSKSSPAASPSASSESPKSSVPSEETYLKSFDCRLSAHDVLIPGKSLSSSSGTITVKVDLKLNKITSIEPLFNSEQFPSISKLLSDHVDKCPSPIAHTDTDADSETSSTVLLDTITSLTILIEKELHKIHSKHPFLIRDFAYPVSSPLHWGRIKLVFGQRMKQVKSVYDFDGQDENELSFNIGDVIDVIYERDDGWLVGLMNGLTGLVPINHVQYVDVQP